MRISRPCYDKYHRCPGWAGGGLRYARMQHCDGGYLGAAYERKAWKWRLNRCPKCRVVVLPYLVRWLDWRWYRCEIGRVPGRIGDWRWERDHRKGRAS